MNNVLDLIYQRRSIRKYLPQAVEKEKVESLLKAAMAAPSAMNKRPWEFVVVSSEEKMKQIRRALTFAKFNAPMAISVCGNLSFFRKAMAERYWVQDCSAATENLLLAAAGLGLGAVWCGVYPIHNYIHRISQILDLPEFVIPLNVILLGYPGEEKAARTQYDEKRVHWEKY